MSVGLKAGSLALLVVLVAYLYSSRKSEDVLQEHLDTVLSGLLRAEKKVPLGSPRVAVGLGACLDVIGDANEILEKIQARAPEEPEHFNHIQDLNQLEKVFTYFFQHGAAAERYMDNATLFKDLADGAKSLPHSAVNLGGNAPVMASRFQREGCQVLLGAGMTESLKEEISSKIKVAGNLVSEDDIHLVMEYKKGSQWGPYVSPRANRFIVHNDRSNPTLSSLDNFAAQLISFSPTLLVVGGLQMLDNFPFMPGQRKEHLDRLEDVLRKVPRETRIHFEMASFAEEDCLRDVIESVVYYSDSLGMNEQELPNLHSILTNGSITLISDPYPRIATTLDHIRAIYSLLRNTPETNGRRKLTRLHVHTLAYQAILTTRGSSWKNTMSATAKASLTANRHTCGSPSIQTNKAKILMDESFSTTREDGSKRVPFQSDRPVSCWQESDFDICIAPVLVCTEVVQTAGGGDNISSAGLVLQI